jgi:hypothetical protein
MASPVKRLMARPRITVPPPPELTVSARGTGEELGPGPVN